MSNIKLFESKQIRSVWNEEEQKWYFSILDVIEILTDTVNAKDYIKKIKKRDAELNSNWGTICPPVEMEAADTKRLLTIISRVGTNCTYPCSGNQRLYPEK